MCNDDPSSDVEHHQAPAKVARQLQYMLTEWYQYRLLTRTAGLCGREARARRYASFPSEPREGSEIPLLDHSRGLPCRVAFERGKERSVYLSVACVSPPAGGATATLLLVEPNPARMDSGVVRAVAPVVAAPNAEATRPNWPCTRRMAGSPAVCCLSNPCGRRGPLARSWNASNAPSWVPRICAENWRLIGRETKARIVGPAPTSYSHSCHPTLPWVS